MARWARRGRRSRRAVSRYWYLGNEAQPVIGPQRVDPFEHDDPYKIRQALAALENEAPADCAIIGEAPEG